MPDFWQVIKKRKSVRNFDSEKDVPSDLIEKIIEAAKQAPSAGGLHSASFIVVRDSEQKKQIARAALYQMFIASAPVVIISIANLLKTGFVYGKRGCELYVIQDAAAATENLLLAATALDLGTCWVGAFDEEKVSQILKLKKSQRPLAIIPIGWEK